MKQRNVSRREPRKDRLIREQIHDPYKTRLKLAEPTVCSQCGAVFLKGRWQWAPRPAANALAKTHRGRFYGVMQRSRTKSDWSRIRAKAMRASFLLRMTLAAIFDSPFSNWAWW